MEMFCILTLPLSIPDHNLKMLLAGDIVSKAHGNFAFFLPPLCEPTIISKQRGYFFKNHKQTESKQEQRFQCELMLFDAAPITSNLKPQTLPWPWAPAPPQKKPQLSQAIFFNPVFFVSTHFSFVHILLCSKVVAIATIHGQASEWLPPRSHHKDGSVKETGARGASGRWPDSAQERSPAPCPSHSCRTFSA